MTTKSRFQRSGLREWIIKWAAIKDRKGGDKNKHIEDIPTIGRGKEQYGEVGQVVKKRVLNGQHSGRIPTEVQAEILNRKTMWQGGNDDDEGRCVCNPRTR